MKTILAVLAVLAILALAAPAGAQSWYASPYSSYMTPSQWGEAIANDRARADMDAAQRSQARQLREMQEQLDQQRRQQSYAPPVVDSYPMTHAQIQQILDMAAGKRQ
jgi:type II secretory pathway pseudopilin PulG